MDKASTDDDYTNEEQKLIYYGLRTIGTFQNGFLKYRKIT